MPLRDHFHPPLSARASWEGFHGQWPAVIVQHLGRVLPERYTAEPRVHLGSQIEIDVAAFEGSRASIGMPTDQSTNGGGIATALWSPAEPSLAVETALGDFDEYEVRVYDAARARRLVAAVEIVSPANKDRPESRRVRKAGHARFCGSWELKPRMPACPAFPLPSPLNRNRATPQTRSTHSC